MTEAAWDGIGEKEESNSLAGGQALVGTGIARNDRMVILHRATTLAFDVCWRWLKRGGMDCAPSEGSLAVLETPMVSVTTV